MVCFWLFSDLYLGFVLQTFTVYMDREKIAELAHSQWSNWMKYLFSKGEKNEDGTWTMPKWAVDRWERQMNMPYSELNHDEKESDRKEADKFIKEFKKEK